MSTAPAKNNLLRRERERERVIRWDPLLSPLGIRNSLFFPRVWLWRLEVRGGIPFIVGRCGSVTGSFPLVITNFISLTHSRLTESLKAREILFLWNTEAAVKWQRFSFPPNISPHWASNCSSVLSKTNFWYFYNCLKWSSRFRNH